ncbi:MAG: NUDIX pyrophosphatase [Clostridia bacterium]|nr:NUDIX pyrophosphatase [Clostridia bacterium]
MRAPFQILAIPYRMHHGVPQYCVFHRSDCDQWQFIAGGGEDSETPAEAATREIFEEGGVSVQSPLSLTSMCYIPTEIFPKKRLYCWPDDLYVIPEYAFGFECTEKLVLSKEHTECLWLDYSTARAKLTWDSNKTALYELHCILTAKHSL